MKQHLPILKFQIHIKLFLLMGLTITTNHLFSQKKKIKSIETDKKQILNQIKQDTLFCAGKSVLRLYQFKVDKAGNTEHYVYPLYSENLAIHIQRKYTGVNGKDSAWYDIYHFKGLNKLAMMRLKYAETRLEDQLCKFSLINRQGLDTLKVETFCVLNPEIAQETNIQQNKNLNISIIPERNINLPVLLEDEKLAQGGVIIGSFEYDTVKGPGGSIEQYAIYNSVGALICTATVNPCTSAGIKNYCWSMLTFKNNKFNSMSTKGDDLLQELLKYLINNQYL